MKYDLDVVRKKEKKSREGAPKPIYELNDLTSSSHCDKNERIRWFYPSAITSSFSKEKENEKIVVKKEKNDDVEERLYGISLSSLIPKTIIENAVSYARDVCKEEYAIEENSKNHDDNVAVVLNTEPKYKDTMREWLFRKHPNCRANIVLSKESSRVNRCFTSIPLSRLEEDIFEMLSSNVVCDPDGYKYGRLIPNSSMLYHETVYKNEDCRFFYDFDCKPPASLGDISGVVERCLSSINEYICARLSEIHLKSFLDSTIYAISWDSSNEHKISKHVFFSNKNDSLRFKNKKSVGSFLKTCVFEWMFTDVFDTFGYDVVDLVVNSFDVPLYERTGEFRIPFSTKLGVNRFLIPHVIFKFSNVEDTVVLNCDKMILLKSPRKVKKKEKDLFFSEESASDDDDDDCVSLKKEIENNEYWNRSFIVSKTNPNASDRVSSERFCIPFFSTDRIQFGANVAMFHETDASCGEFAFVDWRWLFRRSFVNFVGEFEEEEEGCDDVDHFHYVKTNEKRFVSFFKKNQEIVSDMESNAGKGSLNGCYTPQTTNLLKQWLYHRLKGSDDKYKGETPSEIVSKLQKIYANTVCRDNLRIAPTIGFSAMMSICDVSGGDEVISSFDVATGDECFSDDSFKQWMLNRSNQKNNGDSLSAIVFELLERNELDTIVENMILDIKSFIPVAFEHIWSRFSVSVGNLSFKIRQKQARFKFADKSSNEKCDGIVSRPQDAIISAGLKEMKLLSKEDIDFENMISNMFSKHDKNSKFKRLVSSATMRFELENCKYCPIKYDRCAETAHKSNHTFFTVDFLRKKMYLGCHNEECYKHSFERKSEASFFCNVPDQLWASMNIFLQFHVFLRSLE